MIVIIVIDHAVPPARRSAQRAKWHFGKGGCPGRSKQQRNQQGSLPDQSVLLFHAPNLAWLETKVAADRRAAA
jgi:hypothetical protein